MIDSVSEHVKLPKAQRYQNGAPFGFTEYVECKEGWKFVVVNGAFKEGKSALPTEMYLTTSAGAKRYPVGIVTDDGDFFLSSLGVSSSNVVRGELKNSQSPIFVLEDAEKASEMHIGNEKIKLPMPSKGELLQPKLPKIDILSAKFIDSFEMDYSLVEANKDWMKDKMKNFNWGITPIKGKLLSIEIQYESVDNVDMTDSRAISLYDTRGFVSYALRSINS
ncbi:MAG TPA: hypothetical protein VIC26_13405, partial [Marinagarivorans sp.]